MASSQAPPLPVSAVEKVEEVTAKEEKKAVSPRDGDGDGDGEKEQILDNEGNGEGSSEEETLERATELFDKGSKAIKDGDFIEAVDCLSRALEIRVAHHGELAPECAISYYKYGCALLFKAQEEADPLVDVPKKTPNTTGKDKTLTTVDASGSSKTSLSDSNQDDSINLEEVEEGGSDKDKEDDNEGSDADNEEESAEAEEEDSDLDMAWKMLELARAIAEKSPEDTIDKVNIFATLGEVSAEREDVETSLIDYLKAISILERLVEPDNRRIVELNFRVCLVLEVGSKIEEAIPYCQKAISLCSSRLQRLREDLRKSTGPTENTSSDPVPIDTDKAAVDRPLKESGGLEDEVELLRDVLGELETKLEDLEQSLANPKPVLSEVMGMMLKTKSTSTAEMITTTTSSSTTGERPASRGSSQMGVMNGGGFDSPTVSTAATSVGGVMHLGVVGRGVKRATSSSSVNNNLSSGGGVEEPSSKKANLSSVDMTSAEEVGSSVSQVINPTTARDA